VTKLLRLKFEASFFLGQSVLALDVETKAKLEKLVLKTFKTNVQKLEKIAKKKTILLSLYDDKMVKKFEVILKSGFKESK
jgi:hypothetical protein